MNVNKLSKIIAVVFIVLVIGGLALGLISGALTYHKQKEALDKLSDQGITAEVAQE
ncbi:MAG: hypothetical protein ACK5HR_02935 [Mycoplasmatales bacterium]